MLASGLVCGPTLTGCHLLKPKSACAKLERVIDRYADARMKWVADARKVKPGDASGALALLSRGSEDCEEALAGVRQIQTNEPLIQGLVTEVADAIGISAAMFRSMTSNFKGGHRGSFVEQVKLLDAHEKEAADTYKRATEQCGQ